MTKEQLRDIKDFNSLNRDTLRREARTHNVRIYTPWGGHRPVYDASKDELVKSFDRAKREGKFGSVSTARNGNITIRRLKPVVFLKGQGCNGHHTHIAAMVDDDELVVFADVDPIDGAEHLESAEKFVTTVADVRAWLAAVEGV